MSQRIFLLKFAKSHHREQMIVDSGFRCHLTSFTRATATAPSVFVTRLRKYLRTRRVTSVAQVGTDRILEIQFSDGQYRLFLEFYAGGNIVLTDKELVVLSLLRIVGEEADQEELRVGLKYSLSNRQNINGIPPLTEERVRNVLQKSFVKSDEDTMATTKKTMKKTGDSLRKALATSLNEFPPMLIEHALRVANFNPSIGVDDVLKDETLLHKLMLVLQEAQRVIDSTMSMPTPKGYIIAKTVATQSFNSKSSQDKEDGSNTVKSTRVLYEDFHPFRPQQFEGIPETKVLEFDGFNNTVDEFFSSIEGQKLESRLSEREENAKRKLMAARQDHEKRLGGLQQAQELHVRKAQAIEANLQKVQEAVSAINGLIAQGMDWVEIARLIEMEQARHNAVAELIKLPLKLYENTATLLLSEAHFDDEEDYEGNETDSDVSESEEEETKKSKRSKMASYSEAKLAIDVDLALSPWSNARQYYDQKKVAAVKEQKTLQSSQKALKSTERKITADLKKGLKQEKQLLRPVRQQSWFEKFMFFISSDNYLVLGGRDAQQNEILYKKYLKRGDIYVHADMQGAASVIIKNIHGRPDDPIPPSTLSQAGTLAVATSSAWDSKAGMSAWWVYAEQVSKTSPSGEYLATGGFAIRGQKNFLPPSQLILGFGIMFRVSEESKARHLKHRLRDRSAAKENIGGVKAGLLDMVAKQETENEREDSDDNADFDIDHDMDPEWISRSYNSSVHGDEDRDSSSGYHNPLQQPNVLDKNDHDSFRAEDAVAAAQGAPESQGDSEASSNDEPSPAEEYTATPKKIQSSSNGSEQPKPTRESDIRQKNSISSRPQTLHPQPSAEAEDHVKQSFPPLPQLPSASSSTTMPSASSGPAKLPPRVRGKRGKFNKMKTKYAHQDDEDRALALRLLGSAAAHEKGSEEAAARKDREQHLEAQKQRRRQQHALAAEKGREMEEARQLEFKEREKVGTADGVDEEGAGESRVGDLEAFVGSLMPGDEVLDALVMCGPWDAVGARCAWRAKLQPGTTKKGKAVREILGRWVGVVEEREKKLKKKMTRRGGGVVETAREDGKDVEGEDKGVAKEDQDEDEEEEEAGEEGEKNVWGKEAALLRGFREQEVVGVVPVGRCRVVMGGGGGEAGGGKGRGGGGVGKGKRGGRGSKKQR